MPTIVSIALFPYAPDYPETLVTVNYGAVKGLARQTGLFPARAGEGVLHRMGWRPVGENAVVRSEGGASLWAYYSGKGILNAVVRSEGGVSLRAHYSDMGILQEIQTSHPHGDGLRRSLVFDQGHELHFAPNDWGPALDISTFTMLGGYERGSRPLNLNSGVLGSSVAPGAIASVQFNDFLGALSGTHGDGTQLSLRECKQLDAATERARENAADAGKPVRPTSGNMLDVVTYHTIRYKNRITELDCGPSGP